MQWVDGWPCGLRSNSPWDAMGIWYPAHAKKNLSAFCHCYCMLEYLAGTMWPRAHLVSSGLIAFVALQDPVQRTGKGPALP